jgi:acyl carrier protein
MNAEVSRYVDRRKRVLDQLRQVLIDKLNVDREPEEIDPDTPLFGTGLRLDSVDAVELWVNLDLVFGIEPPDDAVCRLSASRTLNTMVDLILAEQRHD